MRHPVSRLRDLVIVAAAAIATPLYLAGPAMASSGYGQLIVNPGTVSPGQTISILGTCPNNGSTLAGVYSTAFVGGQAAMTKTQINFSGTATIAASVSSGPYTVWASCGSGSPAVTITVSLNGTGGQLSASSPSTWTAAPTHNYSSYTHTSLPSATSGGAAGAKTGTPTPGPSSMAAAAGTPGAVAAGNGPVTSTGIVRVGLAGSTQSAMTSMPVLAGLAAVIATTGAAGFLMIRRRRNTTGSTHS